MLRPLLHALAAAAFAATAVPAAAGAQNTITIEGLVRDAQGQPISQAQVAVTNPATNERRGAVTGDAGRFRILGLAPGRYDITVRAIGHAPQTQTRDLLVGQRANLLFELSTSATELTAVAVTATRTTTTEVQRTSVSTPVVREMIEKLPTTDRNVMTLAATAPGIKSFSPSAGRALPSAGAVPDLRFINFYLDGVELKSLFNGNLVGIPQTGAPLPQESIQSFRVYLNPYDTEYSHAGAYVLSAESNRGTNETRGSAFGFWQGKNMTARTVFQSVKPDFNRTQFGFNVRGPIQRDRLFYAANYEVTNSNNYIDVVPSGTAFEQYRGSFKAPNLNHTGFLRLTYSPSERHTVDGMWALRYMTGESNFGPASPPIARPGGIDQSYLINVAQIRHRFLPTPKLLNELSLQLVNWHHDEGQLVTGPQLNYPSLQIGTATFPLELNELHLRFIDRASYTLDDFLGSHVLKAGVELSRVNADQFSPNFQLGSFRFPTDASTTPNQAIIGVGFTSPEGTSDALAELSGTIAGVYVNDEWHPTTSLTLNLGLRYDAELNTLNNDYTVPWASDTELNTKPVLANYLNRGDRENDLNNISPRVSFSWDPFGQNRTFVRGGAGIIFDRVASFIGFQERLAAQWRSYTIANPGTMDVATLRERVASGTVSSTPNIVLVKNKMEAPENRQLSLGVGHQVTPDLGVNVDYVHQDVRHLYNRLNANYRQGTATTATRVLTQRYGDVILWDDFARAKYDAVVLAAAYRRPSLLTNLSYTLGFYRAEYDAVTAPAYASRDFYDMQRTIGDERHRVVLSAVATLPPWGTEISAIATAASPRPYVATLGQDVNNTNDFGDDFYTSPTGDPSALRTLRPSNEWKNWYRNLDLRVGLPIYVRGTRALRATVEVFNVFNTYNIAGYQGRLNNAAGAPLVNAQGQPTFGTPNAAFGARRAQAGLRAEF